MKMHYLKDQVLSEGSSVCNKFASSLSLVLVSFSLFRIDNSRYVLNECSATILELDMSDTS
jgi:hypothetical protein